MDSYGSIRARVEIQFNCIDNPASAKRSEEIDSLT